METTITGILLNEKYVGDLLQVKSFTLDPISKKRLDNYGESDMYYIQDHHETTISREDFEAAQEILRQRGRSRKPSDDKKYHQLSNKYSFSSKLECGFYVTTLSRRACNSKTSYKKVIWQCIKFIKLSQKECPYCKGIEKQLIEKAFLENFKIITEGLDVDFDKFLETVE